MSKPNNIAVFFDRDGTLNYEVKHPEVVDAQGRMCTDVLTPDELKFFPQVKDAFELLKKHNIKVIVVSNQVGFAKGFVTKHNLDAIRQKLNDDLHPDGIYYCTHHEDYTGPCECKKPKKGMLLQAAAEHDIDISKSYFVGDRRIDMQTGENCKHCFMVASREGENPHDELAKLDPELQKRVTIVHNVLEVAEKIVKEHKN